MPKVLGEEVRALNLGEKVRSLRRQRNLTLQQIADRTGLSKPLLSQIENYVAAPPIATLLKISKALGVNIGYFFQSESASDRIVIVPRDKRREVMRRVREDVSGAGYRYESLAYPRADKRMEPFLVEVEPRPQEDLVFYNHEGEEFLHVLEGRLEFRGGDKVIELGPGDSLYFDSETPHAVRGLGGETARILAVIYMP